MRGRRAKVRGRSRADICGCPRALRQTRAAQRASVRGAFSLRLSLCLSSFIFSQILSFASRRCPSRGLAAHFRGWGFGSRCREGGGGGWMEGCVNGACIHRCAFLLHCERIVCEGARGARRAAALFSSGGSSVCARGGFFVRILNNGSKDAPDAQGLSCPSIPRTSARRGSKRVLLARGRGASSRQFSHGH